MDKATYQQKMAEKNANRKPSSNNDTNFYHQPAGSKATISSSHVLPPDGGSMSSQQVMVKSTLGAVSRPWIDRLDNKNSHLSLGSESVMTEKNNVADHRAADDNTSLARKKSVVGRKRFGFREKRTTNGSSSNGGAPKRAAGPVRMEPKVFFANERTFLNWLQFTVLLGSISLTLLNFGNGMTRVSGAVLTIITLLAMIYALGVFHVRLSNILSTKANRQFHDRVGPTVLCVFLFGAYFLNFYTKFIQTNHIATTGSA
ncbi:hypothetical protein BGZ52_005757 [Haplosporangium bisporale]|nr:hypothetical protein BGZ52_005757 [Haplosporangium bisporale]